MIFVLSRLKTMPRLWLGWPKPLFEQGCGMKLLILFSKAGADVNIAKTHRNSFIHH